MTSYTIFNRAENYSELKKKDIKEIKVIRVFIQNKFVIGKPVGGTEDWASGDQIFLIFLGLC